MDCDAFRDAPRNSWSSIAGRTWDLNGYRRINRRSDPRISKAPGRPTLSDDHSAKLRATLGLRTVERDLGSSINSDAAVRLKPYLPNSVNAPTDPVSVEAMIGR